MTRSNPMTDSSTDRSTETAPRRSTLHRAVRVALILLLGGAALELAATWWASGRIEAARERVEARGESLSIADFFVDPPPPPGDNATPYMEAATSLFEGEPQPEGEPRLRQALADRLRELGRGGSPATAEDIELFRQAVEKNALILEILDQAAPREASFFDTDYTVSIDQLEIPNLLSRLRQGDLLAARARLAAAQGRMDDAWKDVALGLRLARWTGHEMPTLIHALVATAIVRRTLWTAEALLWTAPPSAAAAKQLRDEIAVLGIEDLYRTALRGERAAAFGSILQKGREQSWLLRPWTDWNAAVYSEVVTRALDDCDKPAHAREPLTNDPERFNQLYGAPRAALAREYAQPFLFDACNKRDGHRVAIDLFDIALRWAERLQATGTAPTRLAELGEIPTDPFSGAPYRLAGKEGAWVAYSFGGNLEDDGGVAPTLDTDQSQWLYTGDIAWRLPTVDAASINPPLQY